MNPRDRKLRLRKTTLRNLDAESASEIRGGTIIITLLTCTCIWCPKPKIEPPTATSDADTCGGQACPVV